MPDDRATAAPDASARESLSGIAPVGWRAAVLGRLWAWMLIALSKTWRIHLDGVDVLDVHLAEHRPLLVVFWHGQYMMLFPLLRGRNACVFTSLSKRGTILSTIARSLGMPATMIPDKGGLASYRTMRDAVQEHGAGAVAVDGPLGPYHHVKSGAVRLAKDLDLLIFPAYAAARHSLAVRSRWDRLEIPFPFSRVVLKIERPYTVGNLDSREAVDSEERRLHMWLDAARARAMELLD